jgi:serine phosphatase RsbU (regulator of sigma subunit)
MPASIRQPLLGGPSSPLGPPKLSGPAFTAATVLAIALFVSILGSFVTYSNASAAYQRQTAVAQGQQLLEEVLRSQLDEETALRGYLASGQRLFLAPYYQAQSHINGQFLDLDRFLAAAKLSESRQLLSDIRRNHDVWMRDVAQPLISHPTSPDVMDRLHNGMVLVDHIRLDFHKMTSLLNRESRQASEAVTHLLVRAAALTAALMLLFGACAIIADVVRSRTQVALERERIIGDTLQRAFLSGWDAVPALRVGTAYVSAARHAAVGGDFFDVHRIDDSRALLVVADVSGKGLDAAVETAFVKYSIRSLVEDYQDPSMVLRKFNRSFLNSPRDAGSFISVFVAILDHHSGALQYASAGHSPVFLRRQSEVVPLQVTGPIIGLQEGDVFSSASLRLQPHDVLVLATDGLTEARDTAGQMLDDAGAMEIIRAAPSEPQRLADHIVNAVSKISGGRIGDDLALLVIEFEPVPRIQAEAARAATAAPLPRAPSATA